MRPTYILGINAFHPDASAVLLADGEVVGAIVEERLNRIPHYGGFPRLAVKRLFEMAAIGARELDHIAIGSDARANLTKKIAFGIGHVDSVPRMARQRMESRTARRDLQALVAEAGGVSAGELRARIHHIEHHLAHAASAFYLSEHERAAVLSISELGDFASTLSALGEGRQLHVLDRVFFPHSLGVLYTAISQFIGFGGFGEETKVMELAALGSPSFGELFADLVREKSDGRFELDLGYFSHHERGLEYRFDQGRPTLPLLYSEDLVEMLGQPRSRGSPIAARDRDLARSLQRRLEELYFHLLHDLYKRTGADAVCLAGSVTINAAANGKIVPGTPFKKLTAHPAPGHAGTAFGAALFVRHAVLQAPRGEPLRHAFLGEELKDDEILRAVRRADLRAERLEADHLYARTVERLADGKLVGWCQGKMEWGPYALGGRSVLAHPGRPEAKAKLQDRFAQYERFRPFGASVLEERAGEWFASLYPSPFMLASYAVRPEKRPQLQAIDSADHFVRVQTVSAKDCPQFHRLISAFAERTGLPVLLNTDFQENEPIVCTPDEAIAAYQSTELDVLVMGSFMIEN